MSTTEIWANKEIADYSRDKLRDRIKIAFAILLGGKIIFNSPKLIFKLNGKIINLNLKPYSHKPTNKNSQLSKEGKPQKNLQEKRENAHSMNGGRYTESGAVVETPATISPADTNPENFDDGDTKVAPPGEFKAGKPTEKLKMTRKDYRKTLGIKLDAEMIKCVGMHEGKCIGNLLDDIIFEMEEKDLEVPAELMELKQWLRGKGNSFREQGDLRYWEVLKNSSPTIRTQSQGDCPKEDLI